MLIFQGLKKLCIHLQYLKKILQRKKFARIIMGKCNYQVRMMSSVTQGLNLPTELMILDFYKKHLKNNQMSEEQMLCEIHKPQGL